MRSKYGFTRELIIEGIKKLNRGGRRFACTRMVPPTS
jgi:hypothetical protein